MHLVDLFFSFKGRITRLQYWGGGIFVGVIGIMLLMGIFAAAGVSVQGLNPNDPHAQAMIWSAMGNAMWLAGAVTVLILWCCTALSVKRLHDRNHSGWWLPAYYVIIFVPFINVLAMIWYFVETCCLAGTDGLNDFDADPREPAKAADIQAGSWADDLTEEALARRAASTHDTYEPKVLRKRKPVVQRAGGGFGRRGMA